MKVGSIVLIILLTGAANAEQLKYKHPNAIDISDLDNIFPQISPSESEKRNNDDAFVYYVRLVKHIFRKQRFSQDPSSIDHFIANIPLKVNRNQYELLINSDIYGLNLKEIDSLVEDVLMQSKDVDWQLLALSVIDHYRLVITSFLAGIMTPIAYISIALVLLYILNKLFHHKNLTFSSIVLLIILTICGISYYMMYQDCLYDLETEQMIKLSMEKSENNPCNDYHRENESYWSWVKKSLLGSQQSKCMEHMKKTFRPSRTYCDPLDVFAKWTAKIQISYIGSMFEQYLELVSKFTSSSGFITKMVLSAILIIFFGFLITTFLQAVIKHGLQGFFGLLREPIDKGRRNSTNEKLQQELETLRKDNNEIKRELSVLRECSVERERILQKSPEKTTTRRLEAIEENTTTSSD